ncbi:MAG: hypothetical protein LC745_05725, partial [Planctomycetia bacterium]|nr:hypothetical protein [Planctomycetia bacterium]
LDGVIDALDVGLKGAVADAVRDAVSDAVQQAVESVLTRVLTDPELQKLLRQASAPAQAPPRENAPPPRPAAPPRSGIWGKVCSAARSCAETAGTALDAARLTWALTGSRTKAVALGAFAAAAGVVYACRDHIVSAASAAWGTAKGMASTVCGWLIRPAFALAGW